MNGRLFPALLRYWRTRRGFSQLELALESEVSARHISCLETGRAHPSDDMILRLFSVMSVPLNDQNQALIAAGFVPRFESPPADALDPELKCAIEQMMAQHEPFPLVAMLVDGTIVHQNQGAKRLFSKFLAEPDALPEPLDMYSILFSPHGVRPFIVEWESFARSLAARLHREHLHRGDDRLDRTLERIFAQPGVPPEWRQPDFSARVPVTSRFRLSRGELDVAFLVAVTTFSTPQQVTVDELRLESCFPLDERTRAVCASLVPESA